MRAVARKENHLKKSEGDPFLPTGGQKRKKLLSSLSPVRCSKEKKRKKKKMIPAPPLFTLHSPVFRKPARDRGRRTGGFFFPLTVLSGGKKREGKKKKEKESRR